MNSRVVMPKFIPLHSILFWGVSIFYIYSFVYLILNIAIVEYKKVFFLDD